MVEAKAGRIILLDHLSSWNWVLLDAFQQARVNSVLRPPDPNLITKEDVKENVFIVPIPFPGSGRFNLAKHISQLGGTAVILGGRGYGEIEEESRSIPTVHFIGQKGLDFATYVEAITKLLPPAA